MGGRRYERGRRAVTAQADEPLSDTGAGGTTDIRVQVLDANDDPVRAARVRAFVGDWRTWSPAEAYTGNRDTYYGAYSQAADVDAGVDAVGVADLGSPDDWGLRAGTGEWPLQVRNNSYLPEGLDPLQTNPQVALVAEYTDDDGTDWFGSARLPLGRLRELSESEPYQPVYLTNKRLLGPESLTYDGLEVRSRLPSGPEPYGAASVWHAVPKPFGDAGVYEGSDDAERARIEDGPYAEDNHRLFVEVHGAYQEVMFKNANERPGSGQVPVETLDAKSPATPVLGENILDNDPRFRQDATQVLLNGSLGVEFEEDVTVLNSDTGGPQLGASRRAYLPDPRNDRLYALALATAFRFRESGYLAPLYPLFGGLFHRPQPITVGESNPTVLGTVLEGIVKGALGTASTTIGGILTLNSVVDAATGADDEFDSEPAEAINTRLGNREAVAWEPNSEDDWTTDWSRKRNPRIGRGGQPSAFAAVHEVPISFPQGTTSTTVTVRGSWKTNHDIDGVSAGMNALDTLQFETRVDDKEVPAR